jgi:hypothetical protein
MLRATEMPDRRFMTNSGRCKLSAWTEWGRRGIATRDSERERRKIERLLQAGR